MPNHVRVTFYTNCLWIQGVLVSDFYAVYDSFDCHNRMPDSPRKDLNEELLRNPFDSEFK